MSAVKSRPLHSDEETADLMELIETALTAGDLQELADRVLPAVAVMMRSGSAFIYIRDSRLPVTYFSQNGFQPEAVSGIEILCAEQFNRISNRTDLKQVSIPAPPGLNIDADLLLCPLRSGEICVGLIGFTADKDTILPDFMERLLRLLAQTISRQTVHIKSEMQLSHLNNYLTVSSMLAQSLDIHELLDITLHCCIEAISAEAASVLLLDEDKKNFFFYHAEGPAKPELLSKTFPADKGIAGSVLDTQQSEIINDVHKDPRFYGKIDSESGFQTRNMIVIPLVAGEEKIGVLEVLNKASGASFTEEEHLLLQMIAEEIAFAFRNSRVFEYVVNSYCKQRQGKPSCKGCKRPLGSWTPCVKYRETNV